MSPGKRRTLGVVLWLCGTLFAAEPSAVWIDVPFVKQEKDGCGAASIAMVMQYWQQQQGRSGDPNAEAAYIQRVLYSDAAHGIYAGDMQSYFRRHGYRVFGFRGGWPDLDQHLKKGRPLIVALKPGSRSPLHYVVVVGLDPEHQLVLVNDPARRKLLKEDRGRFEQEWDAAERWTLLAVPQNGSQRPDH